MDKGFQREIKSLGIEPSAYGRIILGTSAWWCTLVSAVRTFPASDDFAGKTVVPFMTHGGWPGHVMEDIKTVCRGAIPLCDLFTAGAP